MYHEEVVTIIRVNGYHEQVRTINKKLVEVKRANGRTEYWKTNDLNSSPITKKEIVPTYCFSLEILGKKIFTTGLIEFNIVDIFSRLAKTYTKLYKDHIRHTTLFKAPVRIVKKEYLLHSVLDIIQEDFP